MKRRSRPLRTAKWTSVAVCVTIFSSGWWALAWQGHGYGGRLGWGALELGHGAFLSTGQMQWKWSCHARPFVRLRFERRDWLLDGFVRIVRGMPSGWPGPNDWHVQIPLWPLLLVLAATSLFLDRRDRRSLSGHCPCGYDLTGNVSGKCPECGNV